MNIQVWVSAFILASLHIQLALSYNLTYSTTKTPNFALGPVMSLGAYQTYTLVRLLNQPIYLSLPLAVILGFIVNTGIYLLVIKPLLSRGRSQIMITLASLALSLVISGCVRIYADWINEYYALYSFCFLFKSNDFAIGSVPGVFFVSGLTAFLVYLLWRKLYYGSNAGLRYRAILENPELASVQGINKETTWILLWGLSGSLACLAGAMCPIWYSFSSTSGTMIINAIIAASLLGGLLGQRGFFLGGLVSGLVEILLTTGGQMLFGTWVGEYRPLIPIALIVLTLLVSQRLRIELYSS